MFTDQTMPRDALQLQFSKAQGSQNWAMLALTSILRNRKCSRLAGSEH